MLRASRAISFLLAVLLSGCVHHYRALGIVLAIDRSNQTVTVSHRAIHGYMEAMAMPFPVKTPAELDGLVPGSRVKFDLEVRKTSTVVRHIAVQPAAQLDDIPIPKPAEKLAIGAPVPDFALIDQRGRTVMLSDFRGRLVAIDFIYTRCPIPDVCPRLSANFARLQKRFGDRIVLLSITIDPQYDTPEILAGYARRWLANSAIWHLLTGPDTDIQRIAGSFGLVYWAEEGVITHQAVTAIVNADGQLSALLEGASFTQQQLLDLVEAQLAAIPNVPRD